MSIIIRNAFIMNNSSYSLKELNEIIKKFSENIKEESNKIFFNFKKNLLSKNYNNEKIEDLWRDRVEDVMFNSKTDPVVDRECSIKFIPVSYQGKEYVLGQIYTIQKEFVNIWFKQGVSTEFYFDNRGDQPENISDDDWEFRENIWNTVINEYGELNGFTIYVNKNRAF